MRIIGGIHKGKNITAPNHLPVRPTTDFAKEALFNILNNRMDIEGTQVLDLFSGTGNISLEFASREAKQVVSVDMHFACVKFLKSIATQLNLHQIISEKADVFKFLKQHHGQYDIVFADPPYDLPNIPEIHQFVFEQQLLNEEGILIIEHGPKTKLDHLAYFREHRKYGNVNFSFFGFNS